MGKATLKYKYKGKNIPISEIMLFSEVTEWVLRKRLKDGWCIDDAVKKQAFASGRTRTIFHKQKVDPSVGYSCRVTPKSIKKAETNKKLDDLIEKKRLEKELNDF